MTVERGGETYNLEDEQLLDSRASVIFESCSVGPKVARTSSLAASQHVAVKSQSALQWLCRMLRKFLIFRDTKVNVRCQDGLVSRHEIWPPQYRYKMLLDLIRDPIIYLHRLEISEVLELSVQWMLHEID